MSAASIVHPSLELLQPALAEQLRAHLLSEEGQCCNSRVPRETRLPRGVVDLREAVPRLAWLEAPPWSDGDLRFLVRPEVAERLNHAARALPSDLRIGFWEGLRPLSVQQMLWERGLSYLRRIRPEGTVEELGILLEQYVACPEGVPPPHSTGSAVDIAPVDAFGRVLSPADAWGQLALRAFRKALLETGLVNYEPEWWHWSYGDEEWARANDCVPLAFAATPEFDGYGGRI